MVDGFRLTGFSWLGFAALIVNQLALAFGAFQQSALTPIFAIAGSAVAIYWDWMHTGWIISFTPGKTSVTPDDRKQIWIASIIFAIPLLWLGLPLSLRALAEPFSFEWVLHALAVVMIIGVCLTGYFKHFRI